MTQPQELTELQEWLRGRPSVNALIVDDDDYDRLLLLRELIAAGYDWKVIECCDGIDAIRYFKTGGRADIAFIDIGLPNMDGFEVMKEIREIAPEVRCAIYTGRDVPLSDCVAAGALCLLSKPPDKHSLRRLLSGEMRI